MSPAALLCTIVRFSILPDTSTRVSIVLALIDAPGWKSAGNPGRGRGLLRTGGGVGGNCDLSAHAWGLIQGKSQAKLEASFMSIFRHAWCQYYWHFANGKEKNLGQGAHTHNASISSPLFLSKKFANSLIQKRLAFGWNQSGKTVTPGQTTPL